MIKRARSEVKSSVICTGKKTGRGNLSPKNRLGDRFFSSKSGQVTRQCFSIDKDQTGMQNRVSKMGNRTVLEAGQNLSDRSCPV